MECLCGRTRARHGRCTECARTPARRVKRYELAVRDVLESDESTRGFVWNQPVHGTRLRPDFAWYFQRACVLLEVDEREHASYDAAAEEQRELELGRAIGRPMCLVRVSIGTSATVESVARAVEALLPTLACRIADAQEHGAVAPGCARVTRTVAPARNAKKKPDPEGKVQ